MTPFAFPAPRRPVTRWIAAPPWLVVAALPLACASERVPPPPVVVVAPVASSTSAPPPRAAEAADPARTNDCGGRSACGGKECCVALDGARFCESPCPGAAVGIACQVNADCPERGPAGALGGERIYAGCLGGYCDGPKARAEPVSCAECLADDCDSAVDACESSPRCKAAAAALHTCLRKERAEAARSGCWDTFQVDGGLSAEPNLRACADVRCEACEQAAPSGRRRNAGARP